MEDKNIKYIIAKIANQYKKAIDDSGTNASGKLASFSSDFIIENNHFRITFDLEPYWKFVEEGRRPGKRPPINAIEQWIRIKPIIPDARTGKVPSVQSLAYMISRSIGLNGIKGKHLLRDSMNSPEVTQLVAELKEELIEQFINKMIEEI